MQRDRRPRIDRELIVRLLSGLDDAGGAAPLLFEMAAGAVVDVSDRAARVLGRVGTVTTFATEATALLAAAAAFVGTSRDASGFSRFRVRAFSAQAGTLEVEQSSNGTTWRREAGHTVAVAAGETRALDVPVLAQFVRARYVNGATAQTAFELNTALVGSN